MDPRNEKVQARIRKLLTIFINATDVEFASRLILELPIDSLLAMFFCAFPERNSASGSLYIYSTLISNNPACLGVLAVS